MHGHTLQSRICEKAPPLPAGARDLLRELRKMLNAACECNRIKNTIGDVYKYLQYKPAPPFHLILCGRPGATPLPYQGRDLPRREANFRRDKSFPHFERADGAWFDFSITVEEKKNELVLLAYDFEIRFADDSGLPQFLRYDLNLPDHANESADIRSHLHPSHDDLLAPAPLCSPMELLDLFLHGLTPRNLEKLRDQR